MRNLCKTGLFLSLIIVINGCSSSNRVYKHKKRYKKNNISRNYNTQRAIPATYNYPARGIYPNNYRKINYVHQERPKISRSMQELDKDSASVKPTLVYNYPVRGGNLNAEFVNLAPFKYKMLNYINTIRARGNECATPTGPLGWSLNLEDAASAHAGDMATNNFIGHIGSGRVTDIARKPNGAGSNFYERIMHFGYPIHSGELAGEIITYTKYDIVGNKDPFTHFMHAVDNFQKSAKHCAILMNPRFRDLGIAAYRDDQKIYWVIEYGEFSRQ